MSSTSTLSPALATPILRDLAQGFHQQMYFWGLDVAHRSGNQLVAHGFERRPSPGLKGTSCYRLPWQHGAIELHGTYAGFQTSTGGAYYIRPLGRCASWRSSEVPVAGCWGDKGLDTRQTPMLLEDLRPLLAWWLKHDRDVAHQFGPHWRERCFKQFRKLPRSRAWLEPGASARWLESLLQDPVSTPRARRFTNGHPQPQP